MATDNNEKNASSPTLDIGEQRVVDRVCDEFESKFRRDPDHRIESELKELPEKLQSFALVELICLEVELRQVSDMDAAFDEYQVRFPEFPKAIRKALNREEPIPKRIGRFEIRELLGSGNFGRVFLAHDLEMDRPVALKVPTPRFFNSDAGVDTFFREARIAAKVKHPGLVTVHDIQLEAEQPYIIQEYIQGANLGDWVQQNSPSIQKIVELVVEVAEALVVLHQHDLVHRDLKPANILVDADGHTHVADFGLAMHRSLQLERRGEIAGSPAYMSPEQVRGETNRIDGSTDLWSLGVILYEMLVGRRPFDGRTTNELFDAINNQDVIPANQRNPAVPVELSRICLVCLSNQKSERYTSATHFLDDLRDWLEKSSPEASPATHPKPYSADGATGQETDRLADTSREEPRIIPKGLRSFDESDADFFLDLLPGIPDKRGLPPSVSFWKSHIDEVESDLTFSVGVMYGPSGCGKSSLVNAGILPRLEEHVVPIYVESTPADTEVRLLKRLAAKKVSDVTIGETHLPEVIRCLRDQPVPGRKVLIVLDQFEQWLHSHGDDPNQQLIHALRHCDGGAVQCLVLIRDDFYLPMNRFMQQLDIPLLEHKTIRLVDLFPTSHAEHVLTKLGRAYGALSETLDDKNQAFISESTKGLAQAGKVICVRLSLFAQMMKDKPWTPKGLKAVGGTEGVGVRFLEENFSSSTAAKSHRVHEKAVCAVLDSLLPEEGTDIKGSMRSHDELLDVSGYTHRPGDFEQLVQILDAELRLITPTDPDGDIGSARDETDELNEQRRFYQLTHDYLVPSLRKWLTRKLGRTRRGRAKLRLAERASLWISKPEKRHLPSWWEYVSIRTLTDSRRWEESQKTMMRKADRFHLARAALVLALMAFMGWFGIETYGHIQANRMISTLSQAKPEAVTGIVTEMKPYRRWAESKLRMSLTVDAGVTNDQQTNARIALVEHDESQVHLLKKELLTQRPQYLKCLLDALAKYRPQLIGDLWTELRDVSNTGRRFRAGIALATYAASSKEWNNDDLAFLTTQLINFNPEHQPLMRNHLRPIADRLVLQLESLFDNQELTESQQVATAAALEDFGGDNPLLLAKLLSTATPSQYEILFPAFSASTNAESMDFLKEAVAQQPGNDVDLIQRLELGKKRAGAAITLLRSRKHQDIFDALRVTDDPEAMTQFIHRCRERDVTASDLLTCLELADEGRQLKRATDRKIEDQIMYALIVALGEFTYGEIPKAVQEKSINELATWFRDDPSSAIHGATRWLLCKWGELEAVKRIEEQVVPYSPNSEWFTREITVASSGIEKKFYLTFVVFPSGDYEIGSPGEESERQKGESRHVVTIDYDFAVLDRELTFAELAAFDFAYSIHMQQYDYTPDHPAMGVSWYDSVQFCRWLTKQADLSEGYQCYPHQQKAISDGNAPDLHELALNAPKNWPVTLTNSGFRLPTEAEWEVACRSGHNRCAFAFGNDFDRLDQYAWFTDNSNKRIQVGRMLRPTRRGLFDVHGNVLEWCHDWHDSYHPDDVLNPKGPEFGSGRVYRGGCWNAPAEMCRSAYRSRGGPTWRGDSTLLGFRLALAMPSLPVRGVDTGGKKSGPAEPADIDATASADLVELALSR